jgi:hypothetical protein
MPNFIKIVSRCIGWEVVDDSLAYLGCNAVVAVRNMKGSSDMGRWYQNFHGVIVIVQPALCIRLMVIRVDGEI